MCNKAGLYNYPGPLPSPSLTVRSDWRLVSSTSGRPDTMSLQMCHIATVTIHQKHFRLPIIRNNSADQKTSLFI